MICWMSFRMEMVFNGIKYIYMLVVKMGKERKIRTWLYKLYGLNSQDW